MYATRSKLYALPLLSGGFCYIRVHLERRERKEAAIERSKQRQASGDYFQAKKLSNVRDEVSVTVMTRIYQRTMIEIPRRRLGKRLLTGNRPYFKSVSCFPFIVAGAATQISPSKR